MENWFGTLGYSLSSVAFLIAFFLLFFTQNTSRHGVLLSVCFVLSAMVAGFFAYQTHYHFFSINIFGLETLKNLVWILILSSVLNRKQSMKFLLFGSKVKTVIFSLLIFCFTIEILPIHFKQKYDVFITLHLGQVIFILCLIEQLYRRTESIYRAKIKPFCLGLAVIYTYDLALYSDALLLQHIDETFLNARGWISILAIPFILLTVRRSQQWGFRIYVSRDVLFHSTLLIVSSCYLLIMSLTGYLIKYLGYSWSNVAQYVFLSFSIVVLVSLFLSESLRRKLKVFLVKHFYENKFDYRQEWMNFSTTLENSNENPYQLALASMMKPFNCKYGLLYKVKNNRLIQYAQINLGENEYHNSLNELSCKAVEYKWIIDIDELKYNESIIPFEFHSADLDQVKKIKYIVPIIGLGQDNFVFMLSKINNSNKLDFEDRDFMQVIGKQLSVFLNLQIANKKLTESQQFTAFNQMATFLVHDLKNVLAQLELLTKNASKHKNNPDFIDDAFITIESASTRLSKVLNHLGKHRVQDENLETTNLCDVVIQACKERVNVNPAPVCDLKIDEPVFVNVDKERIKNVFSHLIQNSQDATDPDGSICVSRIEKKGFFAISIEDNGKGMSQDFIAKRLFKPFDTTKGNAGMGIGAYDAKKMIEQLNGFIEVTSAEGIGSRFDIYIPTEQ